MDNLTLLKTLTGEEDEELLSALLLVSERKILRKAYPYGNGDESLPDKYKPLQVEIAQYLYNKRGAEGQTAHREGDVSRTYGTDDIPESMVRDIVPFIGSPIPLPEENGEEDA